MAGYDVPVYNNVGYPFENKPPFITAFKDNFDKNPVGSYRRNFNLPEGWETGKRVFLHFDGACSAIVVWVNGKYAGYSQASIQMLNSMSPTWFARATTTYLYAFTAGATDLI